MPTLTWIGKDKIVNHHHDVPYSVLEKIETFTAPQDTPENSTKNRIIHGDNLSVLKSLLPEFEGRVNCIYIDPPYNTGNENWVYNDNVNDPRIKKWLGDVVGKECDDLTRHDKWLCMMYPRLKLLQRLLADDGVIFISIDDNEQANLRLICDEVFGTNNLVNKFVWKKNSSGKTVSKQFPVNIEYLFMYSKKRECLNFNIVYKPLADSTIATYSKDDGDGKGKYSTISLQKTKSPGPETTYDYVDNNGKIWPCPAKGWRMTKSKIKQLENAGKLYFEGKTLREKSYWNERNNDGQYADTLWDDLDEGNIGTTEVATIIGKQIFDYPKPLDLINRCLEIGTQKNSIILDSFAGSGTTAHAVLKLNAQDGGNRQFILCEMMDYANTITAERVRRVMTGYGEGTKRVDGLGGAFDYYELGEPLFIGEYINEVVGESKIRQYVAYSENIPLEQQTHQSSVSPYLLGINDSTAWIFYYDPQHETILTVDFLATLKYRANGYTVPTHSIIYADRCVLTMAQLQRYGIQFKKTPRDITRL